MRIYFDHAATSYIYDEVIDSMVELMKNNFGNPSSTHSFGQSSKAVIENARKEIAKMLNAEPQEIVFTSSGTEANNMIIRSAVEKLGVKRIITTLMEHKCVLETTMAMKKLSNVEIKFLDVNEKGEIDPEQLSELLSEDIPTITSIMHANNEVGNFYPIQEIAEMISNLKNNYFHTDTVQTIGHLPVDFQKLPTDFASASAHKFHGPKGIGFAFIRKTSKLAPLIYGGGQERNMRSGTENMYGIAGMAQALAKSIKNMENDSLYLSDLKQYAVNQLKSEIPGIQFNGNSEDLKKSLYTVLNILIPISDPMIGFKLDMKGIAVSQGSACSSGAAKTSMVMSRLRTDEELAENSPVRMSFSPKNTKEEIDFFVQALKEILAEQKANVTN